MKRIKVFRTNNKEIKKAEFEINNWIEEENIDVIQIDTVQGPSYSITNFPKSYSTEVEIFITVLYEKEDSQ